MSIRYNYIELSDNLEHLKTLPDNSVDSIVTDSPYGLGKVPNMAKMLTAWLASGYYEVTGKGFKNKEWDRFVPQPVFWKECLRVLKPGGHLLSFFGNRTYHYGALAIALAGFEIVDKWAWIYSSGYPKSKNLLKPAHEPICVAVKSGLRQLNIDECRIPYVSESDKALSTSKRPNAEKYHSDGYFIGKKIKESRGHESGRWPSSLLIDEEISKSSDDFRFFYVAKASQAERNGSKHPTVKPVSLMVQLVKLVTPEGGICLDPHGGTGPTAEACVLTDRKYILIDNDPESVADAKKRMSKHYTLFS